MFTLPRVSRVGTRGALSRVSGRIMPPRCPHGRQRYFCRECGGGGFCEHGRSRTRCKECGGSGLCEHGRERSRCKDCGGSGLCEHGRQRSKCKECGGSSRVNIQLEATVVEVDEDAESDDQWIPVQSPTVVAAGPQGGKRKR